MRSLRTLWSLLALHVLPFCPSPARRAESLDQMALPFPLAALVKMKRHLKVSNHGDFAMGPAPPQEGHA